MLTFPVITAFAGIQRAPNEASPAVAEVGLGSCLTQERRCDFQDFSAARTGSPCDDAMGVVTTKRRG